jgi:hypothetical protein
MSDYPGKHAFIGIGEECEACGEPRNDDFDWHVATIDGVKP